MSNVIAYVIGAVQWLAKYRKAIVAAVTPVVVVVRSATTDGSIDSTEWRSIAGAVLVAALVWLVPNKKADVVARGGDE